MANSALNNITAPDDYAPGSTIDPGVFIDHANIDVTNQAIYWQAKIVDFPRGSPGMGTWGTEVYMLPGSRTLDRAGLCGVRIRAATRETFLPPGQPQALVTVEAIF